jgi:hypothetical protein
MDPTETLATALLAMWDGSQADADDALADLQEWVGRGGFAPDIAKARKLVRSRLAGRDAA